jgi:tetratricopeptide (TPR) repeat protein
MRWRRPRPLRMKFAMEQSQRAKDPRPASRIVFHVISGVMRLRGRTDIPLRAAWRRMMIRLTSGADKTRRQAELAWWQGDAAAAMEHWRVLERDQPGHAAWPLKIAQALIERGDFDAAERVLLDARARGVEDEEVELALLRCVRASRRLNSAIEDAEAIAADPEASPNKTFYAAFYLMAQNRFEGARAGLGRLLEEKKYGPLARGYLAAIELMQEARAKGRPDVPGWVSPAESSFLVREPASDTLVVAFVLPSSGLGLSLNGLHAMLSSKGVNALYLYDSLQVLHLAGTDRFGPGYQAMIDGIRALAAELGTRRLITVGGSATGYTAIRAALDLDADGAMTFGAQSFMPADASYGLARSAHTLQRLRRDALPMMGNLQELIQAKRPGPRIEFYYSALDRRDRLHALNLAGLPNVHLNAIPRLARHDCLTEMARRGYRDLLDVFPAA